ncbi:MAG: hypothetical protein R2827_00055 [Bdellovibrionales bacterium]
MKYILAFIAIVFLAGCSESDSSGEGSSFDSGVPSVDETLETATPSGLVTLTRMSSTPISMRSITDEASLRTFIKERIFTNCGNGTISMCTDMTYYRKWTTELDSRIESLESRFSTQPTCFDETPTQVDFTVGSNTITMYLSCWESHTVPSGVEFQHMAVGLSGSDFYLLIKTKFDSSSGMVFLAKASSAGDVAEIWVLGRGTNGDVLARTFANRTTGAITHFYSTDQPNNMEGLCSFFGRTDGTSAFFAAQDNSSSSCAATTISNSGCKNAADISTNGSDCSSINTAPTGFGTITVTDNSNVSDSNFSTEVNTIINYDLNAAGISSISAQ